MKLLTCGLIMLLFTFATSMPAVNAARDADAWNQIDRQQGNSANNPVIVPPRKDHKQEFISAIATFIDETNSGDGLSAQFFSIADPKVLIPKANRWVKSVYITHAPGGNPDATGLTDPDFDPLAAVHGFTGGGKVYLQRNPIDDPRSSFHEAIHAADYSSGGNGITDDICYATHFFDNEVPGLIRRMRTQMDTDVEQLRKAILSKSPQADQLKTSLFSKLNSLDKRIGELAKDSGWAQAVAATGAKFDMAGYRRAVENLIHSAENEANNQTAPPAAAAPANTHSTAVNLNGEWLCTTTPLGGYVTTPRGNITIPTSGITFSYTMKCIQNGNQVTMQYGDRALTGGLVGDAWVVQYDSPPPHHSTNKMTMYYNVDTGTMEGQSEEIQYIQTGQSVVRAALKFQEKIRLLQNVWQQDSVPSASARYHVRPHC